MHRTDFLKDCLIFLGTGEEKKYLFYIILFYVIYLFCIVLFIYTCYLNTVYICQLHCFVCTLANHGDISTRT